MREIVEGLTASKVLEEKEVQTLQTYIKQKYAGHGAGEQASILANTIHAVLDKRLPEIKEEGRVQLRRGLLTQAVRQQDYNISSDAVLRDAMLLSSHFPEVFEPLAKWVSNRQEYVVSAADLSRLSDHLVPFLSENPLSSLTDIYDLAPSMPALRPDPAFMEPAAALDVPVLAADVPVRASRDLPVQALETANVETPNKEVFVPEEQAVLVDASLVGTSAWENAPPAPYHIVPRRILALAETDPEAFRPAPKPVQAANYSLPGLLSRISRIADQIKQTAQKLNRLTVGDVIDAVHKVPVRMMFASPRKVFAAASVLAILFVGVGYVEMRMSYAWFGSPESGSIEGIKSGLPTELHYHPVDEDQLKAYLHGRQSMLAEDPYFSEILTASKDYDIHPLLMFAITGQEQSFVPKGNRYARQIANNPFNVFHSWKEYNTDIRDSARIAAATVVKLSANCPEGMDPILWINRKYAEDENWWIGVSRILLDMKSQIGPPGSVST